ncbi:antiviral RADAR system adenosine deaminase RdrB [uncultured Pseudomonas sp.]|uniref:antiviral RADAR system adenosine deaminase RdrB n=1 Tax=uncultured Pseudomonas sp. TaxID=114707 RepID=UPI002591F8C9|nr:antiviral RADAR system adenosine deaminase RdrB [uncultured Pseudomonas sp.]
MLNRSLTEHATGGFYGSGRLAERLWTELVSPQKGMAQDRWHVLQGDCYQLLVDTLDAHYPRRFRLNDVRRLMERMCDARLFIEPELPWLDELFSQQLMRNGDMICYRETEVQAYARLAAELDPTLLVSWHLSGWLNESPQPTEGDICRVVSAQAPFFAPPPNPFLPHAEGHVHLGGVATDSAILGAYLLRAGGCDGLRGNDKDGNWLKNEKQHLDPQLKRMRQLLIQLLEHSTRDQDITRQLNDPMVVKERLPDWELLAASHATATVGSASWVCGQFAQAMMRGCANHWLWLLLYLCCLYRDSNLLPSWRVAILCWLQMFNELRRRLIMDGQGLTRFVERYFQGPLRRGGVSLLQDNVRRLLVGREDVAEVKAMIGTFSSKFVSKLAGAVANQSKLHATIPPYIFGEHEISVEGSAGHYLRSMERWHFCGHFSRTQRQKRAPGRELEKLWKSADDLLTGLSRHAGWALPEFLGGQLNQHFQFHPARWFRGLDVAGDENDLRIEWFAPILRWLRRGFVSRPDGERASSGFHLSIHAGEDYAHPLSGMRHVDETVRFCEMRDGDRLGHALALGIDPAQWVARQGEMMVPLDEHLDNLVWLWHYATTLSGRLPLAQQVLPIIERRIARIFPFTLWLEPPELDVDHQEGDGKSGSEFVTVPPSVLFRAWCLRRNCHHLWQKLYDDQPRNERERCAVPDSAVINNLSDIAARIYRYRHQHMAALKKLPLVVVRAGGEWDGQALYGEHAKPVRGIINDVDTAQELEFMHALQDYLMDQYDEMGLIIETNPTSNVYIARLENHSEHPIFRWSPPDESLLSNGGKYNRYGLRRGPVRVLVNTDDPGITPTTLRTEFTLLREAAISLGTARTVAEEWLERLRRYGIEQFNKNHLPVFDEKQSQ